MPTTEVELPLSALYEADETAWLERMAELIRAGRVADLDFANLSEYLSDMAKRERREVHSRLMVLLAHLLKWEYQPDQRSRSWQGTVLTQRHDLGLLLDSGTLRRHADAVLADAYQAARRQAATETGLPVETFPAECPYTVDDLLRQDPLPE
jgi:hypothetical protein